MIYYSPWDMIMGGTKGRGRMQGHGGSSEIRARKVVDEVGLVIQVDAMNDIICPEYVDFQSETSRKM